MLKAKKVSRAVIVGNKKLLDQTVEILHDFNCVHVEDFIEEDSFLSMGKPGPIASEVSHKLIKLRSLSNFLGIKSKHPDELQNEGSLLQELDTRLGQLDENVAQLTQRRNVLEGELKDLESDYKEIHPISAIPLNIEMYSGYESISVFTGFIHAAESEIEAEIRNITTDYELFISAHNKNNVIALFVPNEKSALVNEILEKFGFSEIHIPQLIGEPDKLLAGMNKRREDIQIELSVIIDEITSLHNQSVDFVLSADEVLSITTQKAEAPLRFATSEKAFFIDCWIADDKFDEVANTIERDFGGSVYVSKLDLEEEEIKTNVIPVEYDNPGPVKPFEAIMDLYSRPSYKEIDPSAIIFITFPLFYGLMLGDIGYGLVLLALGLVGKAKLKNSGLKPLATILIYCSISTLIFGVLFAEIFGFHLFGHHSVVTALIGEHSPIGSIFYNFESLPILERLGKKDIPKLLIASALIGVLHLNLGFIIGFRNVAISHGIKVAVFEKISWIVLQLGIGIFALAKLGYITAAGEASGIVIAVLGVVMLLIGEGGAAILELPSILSNTLSYTRLAAIGLSSVGIAFAINEIVTKMMFPKGGIFLVLGIILLLIGHTVNTVLGIIAPGLHSLRLQYVEFFTKFYEGGGRKFNPFGYDRKYTEEK